MFYFICFENNLIRLADLRMIKDINMITFNKFLNFLNYRFNIITKNNKYGVNSASDKG